MEYPQDWELTMGKSSGERTQLLGKKNLQFLSRIKGGVKSSGDDEKAYLIQQMGRDLMKMIN
eukprot:9843688-Ditylum_brightwellii.AAC.1